MVEEVFVEEKSDAPDVSNLPPSVFGVTLADAEEYDRKQTRNALRFHNAPVRDVTKETLGEFMRPPAPGEYDIFTPEVVEAFRGWQS